MSFCAEAAALASPFSQPTAIYRIAIQSIVLHSSMRWTVFVPFRWPGFQDSLAVSDTRAETGRIVMLRDCGGASGRMNVRSVARQAVDSRDVRLTGI
jgi:hypothetical protein